MKKILKIVGIVLGSLFLLILSFVGFIQMKSLPTYENIEIREISVEPTAELVEKGALLASVTCNHCHRADNGKFEGKMLEDGSAGLGAIYTPNITQHKVFGIGKYTDGELYRLLRTGVKRDHHLALPMMLSSRHMSEEDIHSLIAYLKSDRPEVQPTEVIQPHFKPTFIAKALFSFIFKPLPYPENSIEAPSISDKVAYGRYLANGKLICFDCHSSSFETNDWVNPEKSAGYMGGGNQVHLDGMEKPIIAANITMNKKNGIGNWTEEEFISAVKWGKGPDGKPVEYPMLPYTFLDTAEVSAIFAYLKTVPIHEVRAAE